MKEKIQKINMWLTQNLEQALFVVLLLVAIYRGYLAFFVPPETDFKIANPVPPKTPLPTSEEELKRIGFPGAPPPPMTITLPGNYSSLFRRNPFWYHSGRDQGLGGKISAADLNITLGRIRKMNNIYKAQIATPSTTNWYAEGESFEQYRLLEINPEDNTVVIYSDEHNQRFTLP